MSPVYQAILVTIDLSSDAPRLIEAALKLQDDPKLIHLVHACEHPVTGYGEPTGKNHKVSDVLARQQVFQPIKELAERYGIHLDNTHIVVDQTPAAVHHIANELNIDLIIVGCHPKQGFHLFGGSLSSEIIHHCHCPVLTIPCQGS